MTSPRSTTMKFGAFALVMALLTGFLFLIFGQYRTGATRDFSAVFTDVSGLQAGASVRAAGLRVGTVKSVALQPDRTVLVQFDSDPAVALSTGTKAAVRYLNLVGDRYLDLVDAPGSTRLLPTGSQIPADRTAPALDLDQLLGGLKPVIQGLNPQDVNALSASLLQVFQGQGGTLQSVLDKSASFTQALADNGQVVESLIDNLNTVVETLAEDGDKFSATIDRLQQLVSALSNQRDPIGDAITSLSTGTTSLADLLGQARPPLAGTIGQLNRLAPLLDDHQSVLESAIQKAPNNYRKLVRAGSYGSWVNFYLCAIALRVTDLQGRTAVYPWIKQEAGRCGEP